MSHIINVLKNLRNFSEKLLAYEYKYFYVPYTFMTKNDANLPKASSRFFFIIIFENDLKQDRLHISYR